MTCNHPDEKLLTIEALDELGKQLQVEWPAWYRELVRQLLSTAWQPPDEIEWSPLDLSWDAEFIRSMTEERRAMKTPVYGFDFDDSIPPSTWNHSWVYLGFTSLGDTVLDTSIQEPKLWVYKMHNGGTFDLFVDIGHWFGDVNTFVKKMVEDHAAAYQKRLREAEEHRRQQGMKWSP
jgi:hypothetical protein